jgi:hypothetical protein
MIVKDGMKNVVIIFNKDGSFLNRYKVILTMLAFLLVGGNAAFATNGEAKDANLHRKKTMQKQYTPQWEHGAITEIFPNIFFVMGTNKAHYEGVDIQTSRNMIIVKNGDEITLINTVRLDEAYLKIIESMGKVKNIVKIGSFHGRDDAFYLDRYKAKLWALKGMTHDNGVKTDIDLVPNGKMPFPDSSLFVFEATTQPEGIIHIDRDGGILITCDSIKNWTHIDNYFSEQTGKAFMQQGLIKSANVDTVWVNAMHPKLHDFKRLLASFKFQNLLSAHGQPLLNSAYTQVSQSIDQLK